MPSELIEIMLGICLLYGINEGLQKLKNKKSFMARKENLYFWML